MFWWQQLGRLSVWDQLLEGSILYICTYYIHTYILMSILTSRPPSCSAKREEVEVSLCCLCSRECSEWLSVIWGSCSYMYVCVYIRIYMWRVSSLTMGWNITELQQPRLSCIIGSWMIYFPLTILSIHIWISKYYFNFFVIFNTVFYFSVFHHL